MTQKPIAFDLAEGLTSDDAIAAFMAEAFASEDAGYIAHALAVVARAKGITNLRAAPLTERGGPSEPFDFKLFIRRKLAPTPRT
jgi:DNA-binding phage protein